MTALDRLKQWSEDKPVKLSWAAFDALRGKKGFIDPGEQGKAHFQLYPHQAKSYDKLRASGVNHQDSMHAARVLDAGQAKSYAEMRGAGLSHSHSLIGASLPGHQSGQYLAARKAGRDHGTAASMARAQPKDFKADLASGIGKPPRMKPEEDYRSPEEYQSRTPYGDPLLPGQRDERDALPPEQQKAYDSDRLDGMTHAEAMEGAEKYATYSGTPRALPTVAVNDQKYATAARVASDASGKAQIEGTAKAHRDASSAHKKAAAASDRESEFSQAQVAGDTQRHLALAEYHKQRADQLEGDTARKKT